MLLFALVPALTFFGHWPTLSLPIPGTDFYVGRPSAEHGVHAHEHTTVQGDSDDHEAHCHASLATCMGSSPLGDAPVAALAGFVALLGATAAWRRTASHTSGTLLGRLLSFDPPPPRVSLPA